MRFTSYGHPIFTREERKAVMLALWSVACPVCKAAAGSPCKKNNADNTVHMGRVKPGFDSVEAAKGRTSP
jgi:hypothetical protein